jgi:hypothetical protein
MTQKDSFKPSENNLVFKLFNDAKEMDDRMHCQGLNAILSVLYGASSSISQAKSPLSEGF